MGRISSWVGDDQRIPAVVCFFTFFASSLSIHHFRAMHYSSWPFKPGDCGISESQTSSWVASEEILLGESKVGSKEASYMNLVVLWLRFGGKACDVQRGAIISSPPPRSTNSLFIFLISAYLVSSAVTSKTSGVGTLLFQPGFPKLHHGRQESSRRKHQESRWQRP